VQEIDAAIQEWSQTRSVAEVLETLERAQVPAGQIYTVADIAKDPHYRARGMLQALTLRDGTSFEVPGIVPKLSRTPGVHTQLAPQLGEHTLQTLMGLGLTATQIQGLIDQGIVASTPDQDTAPHL
jgi:formyl-CoA transferase